MKIFSKIIIVLAMLLFASSSMAKRETLDKIIVVVGDEVILASEVANQIQLAMFQSQQQPRTQKEADELQHNILEQMVSDRLFLIAAREDTSLAIRDEEIDEMLDEQITRIAQNYESYEQFLDALNAEGLTLRDLKKKYRPDIENQLLKQRYIQRKLYSVSISKHEVEEFYNKFKDSIPAQPEGVRLAHIMLTYSPSKEIEDSVYNLAVELRQRILDGADFATIATNYSTGGAGANGGELGFLSRDDVVPEFARAAFNLNIGDISGVVKTQFGYHIIRCEDIREDKYKLRHVLLGISPSHQDTVRVNNLADSLLQVANNGGDFAELAKIYSQDDETRATGGELGWFAVNQMPVEFVDVVKGWTTPGECRGPVVTRFGVHILKLLEYQEPRNFDLVNDFDRIKELARQDKTGQIVDDLIADMKKTTYIKYSLEE